MPKIKWDNEHVERQQELIEAYRPLLKLGPLSELEQFRQTFPIILPRLNEHGERDGEVSINSYRQYFDFIDANKDLAFYRFQVLYGEV